MTAATDEVSASTFKLSRSLLIQWAVSIGVVALVAAPLAPVLYQSLVDRPLYESGAIFTFDNYARLFGHARFYEVIWNSLLLATFSTIIALGLGVSFALLLERANLPMRQTLRNIALSPMYVSHLVIAFAWFLMYGPSGYVTAFVERLFGAAPWDLYTIGGMSIVAGISSAPLVYLFCTSSAQLADASMEDAGRSLGAGPFRVIWSISLPLMRPAIIYSALLTFIGSLELLSIPLVFGRPVGIEFFTTFLYSEGLGATRPDYGLVGAAAALLLAIISVLLVLQSVLLRKAGRFVTVRGKASRPKAAELGPFRWVAFGAIMLYFVVVLVIPLGGIALRSVTSFLTPEISPFELLTLDNFALIFEYPAYVRSIVNSLIVAIVGGALATAFVALVALVTHRSGFPLRKPLQYVALYPRAVPGIVAGIGLFWATLLLPFMHVLQGTIFILMIAFTMRTIPVAFGAISPALVQIGQELDQSARASGADWWTAVTRIILPLLKPAMFSSYVLLFLVFIKEYASAVFLYAPGSEIIGTTMLSFWANGDSGPVAALSVIQVALIAAFVVFARRALRSHRDV